jgi:hypothetical protein
MLWPGGYLEEPLPVHGGVGGNRVQSRGAQYNDHPINIIREESV